MKNKNRYRLEDIIALGEVFRIEFLKTYRGDKNSDLSESSFQKTFLYILAKMGACSGIGIFPTGAGIWCGFFIFIAGISILILSK